MIVVLAGWGACNALIVIVISAMRLIERATGREAQELLLTADEREDERAARLIALRERYEDDDRRHLIADRLRAEREVRSLEMLLNLPCAPDPRWRVS